MTYTFRQGDFLQFFVLFQTYFFGHYVWNKRTASVSDKWIVFIVKILSLKISQGIFNQTFKNQDSMFIVEEFQYVKMIDNDEHGISVYISDEFIIDIDFKRSWRILQGSLRDIIVCRDKWYVNWIVIIQ